MRCLVTGCAGFIGSHLAEALVGRGAHVRGVDSFTPYYPRSLKEANLQDLAWPSGFEFVVADLRTADLAPLVADVDFVFHEAGQPGVRGSWGDGFADYVGHNVLATQRLLEACLHAPRLRRLVYASSSSIYGNAGVYPTSEDATPQPFSPYGVTKLAGEHLVAAYAANWGLPTVSLRYFTVYGPRQRPDMAMHRFIEAAFDRRSVPLFSDGEQLRDFTYVEDVIGANLAATGSSVPPGAVLNVSGGSQATVNEVIALVEQLTGRRVLVDRQSARAGDVVATGGDVRKVAEVCGWRPVVTLEDGLARQVAWHLGRRRSARGQQRPRVGAST